MTDSTLGYPIPEPGTIGKDAFIHIGLPKTGTTSFQRALLIHRDRLQQHGVRVLVYDGPDDQSAPETRAFDLANCVVRPDLDVWWRAYLPQSALPEFIERGCESIRRQTEAEEERLVASVEDLFLMRTPDEVDRLAELLAPRRVHIVLVVRNTEAWLRSMRAQLVSAGIRPYSSWEGSCANLRSDSWLCDVDGLIAVLESRLGADSVEVIDYDTETERHGSVLPAVWTACGLPEMDVDADRGASGRTWVNRSADWTRAADPPAGAIDEVEWLRAQVIEQAREISLLRRRYSLFERVRRRLRATR